MKLASSFREFNALATYLSGQEIYGDAILASVGYTWKSTDLSYEDLSLRAYYRYVLGTIFEFLVSEVWLNQNRVWLNYNWIVI